MQGKITQLQQRLIEHLYEIGEWVPFEELARTPPFNRIAVWSVIDKKLVLYEDGYLGDKSLYNSVSRERVMRLDELMNQSVEHRLNVGYAMLDTE